MADKCNTHPVSIQISECFNVLFLKTLALYSQPGYSPAKRTQNSFTSDLFNILSLSVLSRLSARVFPAALKPALFR